MPAAPSLRVAPPLRLAGVSFYGNPFLCDEGSDTDRLHVLWGRYHATLATLPGFAPRFLEPHLRYEVHIYGEEALAAGMLEVFAAQAVPADATVPYELCVKAVAAARYAVLDLRGEESSADWRGWLSREWLAQAGFEALGSHDLLLLRLERPGEWLPFEAWVPIRERR
jgi:hypothetical protein